MRRTGQRGFTLIELLIVVAIIGVIAAILIPNLLDALQKTKQKRTMAEMRITGTAVMSWLSDQAGAAVMHDRVFVGGLGQVEVRYFEGGMSRVGYQNLETVLPGVDAEASYVQALFWQMLGFRASEADVAFWRGVLHGPGGREGVVEALGRSEAARSKAVHGWFTRYLGGPPLPPSAREWLSRIEERRSLALMKRSRKLAEEERRRGARPGGPQGP